MRQGRDFPPQWTDEADRRARALVRRALPGGVTLP
jgi:hypothetical protein